MEICFGENLNDNAFSNLKLKQNMVVDLAQEVCPPLASIEEIRKMAADRLVNLFTAFFC